MSFVNRQQLLEHGCPTLKREAADSVKMFALTYQGIFTTSEKSNVNIIPNCKIIVSFNKHNLLDTEYS
jgi:hypothetical protein